MGPFIKESIEDQNVWEVSTEENILALEGGSHVGLENSAY
jgi:hypothetical protein